MLLEGKLSYVKLRYVPIIFMDVQTYPKRFLPELNKTQ